MPRQPASDPGFEQENRRRSQVTVGELAEAAPTSRVGDDLPTEPLDFDAVIARLGPQRWAELLARRDRILGRHREQEEEGG
jgi:hypothetical protein